jgi:hypothetical protein
LNYYIPETNQTLYLYNKEKRAVVKIFKNQKEVEDWIINNLRQVGDQWYGLATQLSLNVIELIPKYGQTLHWDDNGHFHYEKNDEIVGYDKYLVIISNYKSADQYSIYNYTYQLETAKTRIANGEIPQNYARWWGTPRRDLPEYRNGPVPHTRKYHHSSRANLIINKSDRAAFTEELESGYYDREADEFIEYELPRNIKMSRGKRRALTAPWESGYARRSNHDDYKKHQSWKFQKKAAQWM